MKMRYKMFVGKKDEIRKLTEEIIEYLCPTKA